VLGIGVEFIKRWVNVILQGFLGESVERLLPYSDP